MPPIQFGQILWKSRAWLVTDPTAVSGVQYASQAEDFRKCKKKKKVI
jgi:hypothetical protein